MQSFVHQSYLNKVVKKTELQHENICQNIPWIGCWQKSSLYSAAT